MVYRFSKIQLLSMLCSDWLSYYWAILKPTRCEKRGLFGGKKGLKSTMGDKSVDTIP